MNLVFIIILGYTLTFFYYFKQINNYFKLYDYPNIERKKHGIPMPYTGGLFILIVFNIFSIYQIFNGIPILFETTLDDSLLLLIYLNLFFFIGLLDDKKKISFRLRIILNLVLIYFIVITHNLNIEYLKFNFFNLIIINSYFLQILFTIFCIFVFLNALNMYDGINGQSGFYILFIIFIFYVKTNNIDFIIFIYSIIVFVYYNIKNKFFIGNSGINFFSILISYLIIKSYKSTSLFLVEDILSLMFLPGIELIRLFFCRILNKKNPFIGDVNHIHHILKKKFSLFNILLINNFLAFSPFVFLYIIKIKILILLVVIFYFFLIFKIK